MGTVCDVAIVGLGALGSSTLYALAKQGVRVVGIDRFAPPHVLGSSHGETRITRQAIGEGDVYVPFALRSHAIWDELEAATGRALIERVGFLQIMRDDAGTACHGKSGFLATTIAAARRHGIVHETLNSAELAYRFPQFAGLTGDEDAYFEPGGGFVRPENCIEALLRRAGELGARIVTDSAVQAIEGDGAGYRVRTADGWIAAGQVVVAAGAWAKSFAPRLTGAHVRIYRQSLHWFPIVDPSVYRPGATPTFYWSHGSTPDDVFYGFPPVDGLVKIAEEQYANEWDVGDLSREVSAADQQGMAIRHVIGKMPSIAERPSRSKACLYSVTADFDFLVDEERPGLHLVSACSGHGFKHAPAVGEALAARLTGAATTLDLAPFRQARFAAGA